MRRMTSCRGNEDGSALLASLVLVAALSLLVAPLAEYACLRARLAGEVMERVLDGIESRNAAVAGNHEFD